MKEIVTFDDVLIAPKFSTVESRKEVDLSYNGDGFPYVSLPIISANMDTITGTKMSQTMIHNGAQACLHRFQSIEDNVGMFLESGLYATGESWRRPFVSIGLGNKELERAEALYKAGALVFFIDVAHGASIGVVKQVLELRKLIGYEVSVVVGNFATSDSVKDFLEFVGTSINGIKIGIGPGSVCTTRIKTGVGYPQLSAVLDIAKTVKNTGLTVIADGGMKTPGDIAKALGAGAHMCMLGGMLAGTYETPGELTDGFGKEPDLEVRFGMLSRLSGLHKKFRGSASKESYEVQGKEASHRTTEGESFLVPYKGPVKDVLQDIEGGLRSSFSYVGAKTLKDFHGKVEFVKVSSNTVQENKAHGKDQ